MDICPEEMAGESGEGIAEISIEQGPTAEGVEPLCESLCTALCVLYRGTRNGNHANFLNLALHL